MEYRLCKYSTGHNIYFILLFIIYYSFICVLERTFCKFITLRNLAFIAQILKSTLLVSKAILVPLNCSEQFFLTVIKTLLLYKECTTYISNIRSKSVCNLSVILKNRFILYRNHFFISRRILYQNKRAAHHTHTSRITFRPQFAAFLHLLVISARTYVRQ